MPSLNIPISVLIGRFPIYLEAYIQIRACAEDLPVAGEDNAFYAVVYIEHAVCLFEF